MAREVGNRRLEGNTLCNLGLLHQVQGRFTDALDQLEAALDVARDLGHARLECVVLCNLGMVYDSLARFDEARDHFEAALVVARDLGDRRSEGQFLSYLGLLHARQGDFDEARHCLDSGEALLRAVSDRMSLGILLCSRAETEHLAGSPRVARGRACGSCRNRRCRRRRAGLRTGSRTCSRPTISSDLPMFVSCPPNRRISAHCAANLASKAETLSKMPCAESDTCQLPCLGAIRIIVAIAKASASGLDLNANKAAYFAFTGSLTTPP